MGDRDDGDIGVGRLVLELVRNPAELEWLEFKENNVDPQQIGEYISALSNSAALHGKSRAFLVWGVQDGTHQIVGTGFSPATATRGAEPLIAWLARLVSPRIDFAFRRGEANGAPVVVLEVPAAEHVPVRFSGEEYIRVGSSKRKLRDFPEKERNLWQRFSRTSFEEGIADGDVGETEVLTFLDFASYFDLAGQPAPATHAGVLDRLADERFIRRSATGRYETTNLGAITLGKPLQRLSLERKAVRVIVYPGPDRMNAIRAKPRWAMLPGSPT